MKERPFNLRINEDFYRCVDRLQVNSIRAHLIMEATTRADEIAYALGEAASLTSSHNNSPNHSGAMMGVTEVFVCAWHSKGVLVNSTCWNIT